MRQLRRLRQAGARRDLKADYGPQPLERAAQRPVYCRWALTRLDEHLGKQLRDSGCWQVARRGVAKREIDTLVEHT